MPGSLLTVRLKRWGQRLLTVFAGQAAISALSFVASLLVMRWMNVTDFAKYGVVFGFQCAIVAFADLGFSGCIISLVGSRVDRPEVVGAYIAAARWTRVRLLALVGVVAGCAFWTIGNRQGWPVSEQVALFSCILLSIYFEGWSAWFRAPLLMHQRLALLYAVSAVTITVRILSIVLCAQMGVLNAITLAATNCALSALDGIYFRRMARSFVREPAIASAETRTEMFHYLAPLIPGIAFNALQGQIGTFLIGLFGRTQGIAELSALGRLGQIFVLLSAVPSVLIAPYFARLQKELLWPRYFLVLGAIALFLAVFTTAGFAFPAPLLLLMGKHYQHLDREIGWMVLSNSIAFFGGVLWSMHSARKWIFWAGTWIYISLLTVTQTVLIATMRLDTPLHVLWFSTITNCAVLAVHAATAWLGYRSGRLATPDLNIKPLTPIELA